MERIVRFIHRIGESLSFIGTIAMLAVVGIIMTNIVLRFFGKALLGTYEAVGLLMVVMISFGIAYCAIKKSHVAVNIVLLQVPKRVQTILSIITTTLSIGIWLLIVWCSAGFARKQWLKGEATDIMEWPIYPMRFVFVLGAIILCLVLLLDLINTFRGSNQDDTD